MSVTDDEQVGTPDAPAAEMRCPSAARSISTNPDQLMRAPGPVPSGVSRRGALLVDPDVDLRMRGGPLQIRHVYNSHAVQGTWLGQKWNHSLIGDLYTRPHIEGDEQQWTLMEFYDASGRRTHGGLQPWGGTDGANDWRYLRYAGCYNTMQFNLGSIWPTPSWTEQTPTGEQILYVGRPPQGGSQIPPLDGGPVAHISDLSGNKTYFAYDAVAEPTRPIRVDDPTNRSIYFEYAAPGQWLPRYLSSMKDWAGRVHYYEHDVYGNLTSQKGPEGCITSYEYDLREFIRDEHLMTKLTDPDGYSTYYTYMYGAVISDQSGGLPAQYGYKVHGIQAANLGWTYYNYDVLPGFYPGHTHVVDALGNATYYKFDLHHNVSRAATAGGRNDRWTIDGNNNAITQYQDSRGSTTTYATDDYGNRTSITNALSQTTYYNYHEGNEQGNRLKQIVGPLLQTTYFDYDAYWNLSVAIDPLGQPVHYDYDETIHGQLVSRMDRRGNRTYYEYDGYGNVISIKNAIGETTSFSHDPAGNIIARQDPLGYSTYYEYDQRDRVTKLTDPLLRVTELGYDGRGNLTVIMPPDANPIYFDYDSMSNLTRYTDQVQRTSTRGYDLMNNLLSDEDPLGNASYYEYDTEYRPVESYGPNGSITYFGYDANGNLTNIIDPTLVNTTYLDYDALDRNHRFTDAKGNLWQRSFDGGGRPTQVVAPALRDSTTYTT